jgi:DNA polymerase-3 subunit delta
MKIRQEQLASHLKQTLAAVYCVMGEELLQSMEAVDMIRKAANHAGYHSREILTVEGKFDWTALSSVAESLSLFSEKQIIDLRLPTGKWGIPGSKAIQGYLSKAPSDKLLIIQLGKFDYRSRNSAWFKAIDQAGVIIQVWALSPAQTLAWVAKRMRQAGLQASQEVVRLLSERVEGNLLAASQEIQKLYSVFGASQINEQQLIESVSDSSRFSTFDLSDAVLLAQPQRVQHILSILQQEDTPLALLLWVVSDLSRKLYHANHLLQQGKSDAAVINTLPRQKQALYRNANQRLYRANWHSILNKLIEIDWKIKGVGQDSNKLEARIWDDLGDIALSLAGVNIIKPMHKLLSPASND